MRSERSAVTPLLLAALIIAQAIAAFMTWGWFG